MSSYEISPKCAIAEYTLSKKIKKNCWLVVEKWVVRFTCFKVMIGGKKGVQNVLKKNKIKYKSNEADHQRNH
jgi:hypothetical protein